MKYVEELKFIESDEFICQSVHFSGSSGGSRLILPSIKITKLETGEEKARYLLKLDSPGWKIGNKLLPKGCITNYLRTSQVDVKLIYPGWVVREYWVVDEVKLEGVVVEKVIRRAIWEITDSISTLGTGLDSKTLDRLDQYLMRKIDRRQAGIKLMNMI